MKTESELSWLIKTGDLEDLRKHLTGSNVNTSLRGRSPLHLAADFGHLDIIQYLIDIGGDVNAVDRHGISVLLAAVSEGHEDAVTLLLQKGASKEGEGPDGRPYASWTESQHIKTLLL